MRIESSAPLMRCCAQYQARVTEAGTPTRRIKAVRWGTRSGTLTQLHPINSDAAILRNALNPSESYVERPRSEVNVLPRQSKKACYCERFLTASSFTASAVYRCEAPLIGARVVGFSSLFAPFPFMLCHRAERLRSRREFGVGEVNAVHADYPHAGAAIRPVSTGPF